MEMRRRGFQNSVTRTVVAITLFLAIRAACANTIIKVNASDLNTLLAKKRDLLGTPSKIAVNAGQVYVLTNRGWIYSVGSSLQGTPSARLPGPLVASPAALRPPATALAITSTDVYAAQVDDTTTPPTSTIFHYNSALSSLSSVHSTVSGWVVDLTVGSDGWIYGATREGQIFKMDPSLGSRTTIASVGASVVAIKTQTRKTISGSVVDLYVTISDGMVYRFYFDTSQQQVNRNIGVVPVAIGSDSTGDVIVATKDDLHKISLGLFRTTQQLLAATDLKAVDLDNSSNVVTIDKATNTVYRMAPNWPSPETQDRKSAVLPATPTTLAFSDPTLIAIDSSDATSPIYIVGGSFYDSEGDPHLTTINGMHYDFQSAGEFVLLRHAGNSKIEASSANSGASNSFHGASEIQVRQFPVATTVNTCVSLNSAIAAQVGKHRVTYEPNLSGQPDPSGLQLRIDGNLITLDPTGISLDDGGRVVPILAGGIEIDFPNDDILFVTPGWWDSQGKWYLNLRVVPQQRAGGLMGDVPEGSWLPALSDGTSIGPAPTSPHERYVALYQRFADAWRVTDKTSLFDYVPGTSTKTFTTQGWPPENGSCSLPGMVPVQGTTEEVARRVCKRVPGDQAN